MLPSMTVTQQYTLTLNQPTDRKGNPAQVQQGSVDWASSDPAVARVEEDPTDEKKALVVAQGTGPYTISVTADADLGEGVTMITGQDTGEVSPGVATSVGFSAGPVEEQP